VTAMMICFIGGGNPLNGAPNGVARELSRRLDAGSRMLVVPFAAPESKYDGWLRSAEALANRAGFGEVGLLDPRLSDREMQDAVLAHQALFFTGGRPERLMDALIRRGLLPHIRRFPGMVIGVSAGALALCRDCVITKDEDYPETQVIEGMGFTDFSVEVHYDGTTDAERLPLSFGRIIFAIPDGCALLWDGKAPAPVGRVCRFLDGRKDVM